MIKTITAPPVLQRCSPEAFFPILDQIDLTALKEAVTGFERRGPKLKEPDAIIRLYLWGVWCQITRPNNAPTVAGLHHELEDPESALASWCKFRKGERLPDRTTLSNHNKRINEHPELVRDVLLAINKFVRYTPLGESSSKTTRVAEKAGSRKGNEPQNRDKKNADYRRRRRQEALGDDEFAPIVKDTESSDEFLLNAIHMERPKCHICPEQRAKGRMCTRNHLHDVVVEANHEPNKPREWKCHCCESKLSIIRGTAFHGTHFSSKNIISVLRYMVHFRLGISTQDMAGFLNAEGRNVSEDAVRMMTHRLRECMRELISKRFKRFEGETEIDEMLLRLNDGKLVSILTAYNRPTHCARFRIIERKGRKKPKATQKEMLHFIRETTVPGSIILTDGDAAVPIIKKIDRKHGRVNHKRFEFLTYGDLKGALDKIIEITTNRAEGVHGFVRRTLYFRNGVSRHHLERYLAEATWRINFLHNQVESQSYQGDERRNLFLMREVLTGAAGRKITLKDLRGEPQQKSDKSSKQIRTAPLPSEETPEQKTLAPRTPIVPGAQQAENDRAAEVKDDQPRPTNKSRPVPNSDEKPPSTPPLDLSRYVPDVSPKIAEDKPDQRHPSRTGRQMRPSRKKNLQKSLPLVKREPALVA